MSKETDLHAGGNTGSLYVPTDWVPITPGASALAKPVRALRANTDGTITATTGAGNSRVMNFLAGETRYGAFTHVTAATCSGIEGAT